MQGPMDQFLSALRGLEELETPLSFETPTSPADMRVKKFDPNAVEAEEMGVRQENLRRAKVRQLSKAKSGQTQN